MPVLNAADLIKADNTSNLRTAGTYAAPNDAVVAASNADWVIFNNTFATTTGSVASGGSVAVLGLRVVDPGNDVTLALGNATFSIGVSGGTSGSIDLSSATKNLTITSGGSFGVIRMMGSTPTISVASGRTLTMGAPISAYNGGNLTITGAGTTNLNGTILNGSSGTTRVVYTGTDTLTLGGLNSYTGGTSVSTGTVAISQNFTMSGANAIGLNAAAGTHGEITFGGSTLTLGGSLQLDLTGDFAVGGTFDLIDFGAGVSAGNFSAVSIAGSYVANLSNNGSGVWSGAAGTTTFVFDQASGDLTVSAVPEPTTISLLIGGLGFVAALTMHRRRA
ncbi:PEP-CTERM sorting domain-containing protein [Rariglobus hedericola]